MKRETMMKKIMIVTGLIGVLAVSAQAQEVVRLLFDFGVNTNMTVGNWNNVSTNAVGIQVANAVNSTGGLSGVSLRITDTFNPTYTPGTGGTVASNLYPTTAQQDYFTVTTDSGEVRLEGLNTSSSYSFTFFGSRTTVDAKRVAKYSIGTNTVTLNCSTNANRTVSISGVMPDASGTITVVVSNNVADSTYYGYLGVLDVLWTNVPSGPQPSKAMTFVIE